LARGGIWQLFWSSSTVGIPSLEETELPGSIVVNAVLTEPFRTRGRVIIDNFRERFVMGVKFLLRLLADYGKVEIILTDVKDPLARRMYKELAGFAWIRLHPVSLKYPVENPLVLRCALKRGDSHINKKDTVWVIDVQGLAALGACLGEGYPLYRRVVAAGGPAHHPTTHISALVGTPLSHFIK